MGGFKDIEVVGVMASAAILKNGTDEYEGLDSSEEDKCNLEHHKLTYRADGIA